MSHTSMGPATEPEPVQLPAGKEWKRTIIVNDDALSPVGQEQVDHRDAEIAELRAELDKLADFIMFEVPGEPSQSQGAVDTAIRLIRRAVTGAEGGDSGE